MRTIGIENIGKEMADLILENNPIDEDIGIFNKSGNLLGVVIAPKAYEFFLEQIEEEEDRLDNQTVSDFHESGEKSNEN